MVREVGGLPKEDGVEGFTDEETSRGLTEVVEGAVIDIDVVGGLTEWGVVVGREEAQSPSSQEYPDRHLEQLLPISYIDAPLKFPASA